MAPSSKSRLRADTDPQTALRHIAADCHADLLKYRAVARGDSARAATSTFFLVPRQQVPGRAVYFLCEQRCTAYADFSKTVTLEIRFPPERLGDWATIERKVRGLVDSFARP